ncbi:ATP-dependent DNA helicase, RecQ family [Thermosipho melanesiensis BI429]|uniref:DNA 3'-5' helicase n=1 Tax=Thermosipho melanesiensis (strain DSM 12029 / CIP 104789 / BI429) TaxID=391009 RepID=A6LJY5_THEM4|nr:ATP-dependent DNA helicase, RecQ family [Thermosipho melanesiensis BI429]
MYNKNTTLNIILYYYAIWGDFVFKIEQCYFDNSTNLNNIVFDNFEYSSAIDNFKFFALKTYFPRNKFRDEDIEFEDRVFRNIVYEFKKGNKEISEKMASVFVKLLKNVNVKKPVICAIPASNFVDTEKRFKYFTKTLSKKLNFENGFSYIQNKKNRRNKHFEKFQGNIIEYISINKKKIKGKTILLFDDIITTGNSFITIANKLVEFGAENVIGVFLGKTYDFQTKKKIQKNTYYDKAAYIFDESMKITGFSYEIKTFNISKNKVVDNNFILTAKIVNNIIMRGIPTFASKYLFENTKDNYKAILSAWLHRVIIFSIVNGILTEENLNIAIIERDISFSHIAIKDLYLYMENISKLLEYTFPKFNVKIFNNPENKFNNFDLVIDIGFKKRQPLTIGAPYIFIQQTEMDNTLPRFYNFKPIKFFKANESNKEKENALKFILQNVFFKEEFREGQLKIIKRILSLNDTIGLLPTGGGKSLCYQLSGLLQPGIIIVIDPIKSLMVDQVDNLEKLGINSCAYLNSDLERSKRDKILKKLEDGNYKFLFIAPERLQIKDFRKSLSALSEKTTIPFIVIDEAHCVSEWGHDFRPSYLNISKNIRLITQKNNYKPKILALTGTASYAVLNDIQKELEIFSNSAKIYPKSFDRKELHFIIYKTSNKEKILKKILLTNLPKKFGKNNIAGIIFSSTVDGENGTEHISTILKSLGIHHLTYSGKVPKKSRLSEKEHAQKNLKTQKKFKENKVSLLVATKAFGMGIDKPNIRYTIHYTLPSSLEAFYQEAGRAGRDRNPAFCYLIFTEKDENITNAVLDISKSADYAIKLYNEQMKDIKDDVTTQVFFHKSSFVGENEESEKVINFLEKVFPTLQKYKNVYITVSLEGRSKIIFEKILHRLSILGVVKDYTVKYDTQITFEIKMELLSENNVYKNLFNYVTRYSLGENEFKVQKSPYSDLKSSYKFYIKTLVKFIYSEIEKQRRRALFALIEMARHAKGENEIKKYILNYFEETTFSRELWKLYKELDFETLFKLLTVIQTKKVEKIKNLYGNILRFLESAPDNPSFYLLTAFIRTRLIYSQDREEEMIATDVESIKKDWENFLRNFNFKKYENELIFIFERFLEITHQRTLKNEIFYLIFEKTNSKKFVEKFQFIDETRYFSKRIL